MATCNKKNSCKEKNKGISHENTFVYMFLRKWLDYFKKNKVLKNVNG